MANVEMYYSEWCGYCHRARHLLEMKGVTWTGIDVDMEAGKRQEMMDRGGGHTVPQLFVDSTPIGGCAELFALESEGRLDAILGFEGTATDEQGSNADG
jgi:glutaredoxin 3